MSATHEIEVMGPAAKATKLRITICHEDEHAIPLFRTAIASMLLDSLSAAEDAGHKVSASAQELFSDEFDDDDDAGKIVKTVTLVAIESGKVTARNPAQGVRFNRKGKAACALVVDVTPAKASLFSHLKPGLKWSAAPLFPEMEEDWPVEEDTE